MNRDEVIGVIVGLSLGLVGVAILFLAVRDRDFHAISEKVIEITRPGQLTTPLKKPPTLD